MNLIIIPILAGIFGGITETIYKSVSNKKFRPATYIFIFNIIACIITFPLFLVNFQNYLGFSVWFSLFFAIFSYVLANYCLFSAYKIEDISNINVIKSTQLIFPLLLGTLFLKENITNQTIFGALMIFIGVVFIFLEKDKIKNTKIKGLFLPLLAAFFYSVAALFVKIVLKVFSPYFSIFLIYLGLAVSFSLFPNVKKEAKELFRLYKPRFFIAGFLGTITYLLTVFTLKNLDLSIGYPIFGSTNLISAVLIGILILKEKSHIINKIIGTFLVVIGIFIIY